MRRRNIYKFFDYLGFPAFLYLFIDALCDIAHGISGWRIVVRLLIAFFGMIIDGYLIFIYKDKNIEEDKGV
jgi:hypothetical protein